MSFVDMSKTKPRTRRSLRNKSHECPMIVIRSDQDIPDKKLSETATIKTTNEWEAELRTVIAIMKIADHPCDGGDGEEFAIRSKTRVSNDDDIGEGFDYDTDDTNQTVVIERIIKEILLYAERKLPPTTCDASTLKSHVLSMGQLLSSLPTYIRWPNVDDEFPHEDGHGNRIKRPINNFMIFSGRYRTIVHLLYSDRNNRIVSTILGRVWASLPLYHRHMYSALARIQKEGHSKAYPSWVFARVNQIKRSMRALTPKQLTAAKRKGSMIVYEKKSEKENNIRENNVDDISTTVATASAITTSGSFLPLILSHQSNTKLMSHQPHFDLTSKVDHELLLNYTTGFSTAPGLTIRKDQDLHDSNLKIDLVNSSAADSTASSANTRPDSPSFNSSPLPGSPTVITPHKCSNGRSDYKNSSRNKKKNYDTDEKDADDVYKEKIIRQDKHKVEDDHETNSFNFGWQSPGPDEIGCSSTELVSIAERHNFSNSPTISNDDESEKFDNNAPQGGQNMSLLRDIVFTL